ncbi:MAG: hypothetical protein ACYTFG_07690 [Planctomycetota bacterium]
MVKLGDWMSEGFNMLKEQFWAWVLVMLVFFCLSLLVYTCIGFILVLGVMMFGPHAVALNQLRGRPVQVGDLFSTFNLILPALGFICIILLLAVPSMLLLMIPMFFIAPMFFFVPHLIVDQKMGVIEAMKKSWSVVKQDYWWFLLANLVIGFVSSLGSYACYVGILATMPLFFTIQAVAYRDCFGVSGARSFKSEEATPASPPPRPPPPPGPRPPAPPPA